MTIYICIYLYCQVDERVWIRVKERSRKICLSAARARDPFPFAGREKREAFATARGACRACAVKTRQNDVEFLDRRGDDEAEISSSSRRTSIVR